MKVLREFSNRGAVILPAILLALLLGVQADTESGAIFVLVVMAAQIVVHFLGKLLEA